MKVNKTARYARWILLALLLAWVTYETIMHQVLGGGKSPSIHALCPYGAIESLYAILVSGTLLQKIYSGTFLLLGTTVLIAILFRRSFCGLLCPFGALQELFARIGLKIWKKRPLVPARADRVLRYLKYFMLFLTAFLAWRLGRLWMSPYDPYAAYGHITTIGKTIAEDPWSIVGFVLLGVSLVGSFIYDRFFCKYLCPAGALYAIIGKISPTKIVRDKDVCINCNLCSKACPVNIDVAKTDRVTTAECINCNECVAVCPKKGALAVKTGKKAISPLVILILVAALFFVPIWAVQAAGAYEVLPSAVLKGETIAVSEIKGYMNLHEAALATGFSEDELRTAMGLPDTLSADVKMNEISSLVPGFDFDAAKEDAEVVLTGRSEPESTTSAGSASSGTIDVSEIRGSMTIADAAVSLDLSLEAFYDLFKIPQLVPGGTRMKDIANVVPGYDFHTVKDSLK